MKYFFYTVTISLALLGCGSDELIIPDSNGASNNDAPAPMARKLDFGDVEAQVRLESTMSESDLPDGGSIEELRTAEKRLTSATITIEGRAPETLPITLKIVSRADFSGSPVVLRGHLVREIKKGERERIFDFSTLVVEKSFSTNPPVTEGRRTDRFIVDVLKDLPTMPETMLLYMEVDAILTEEGTDPESIDIAGIEGGIENSGTLLGNALRINYIPLLMLDPNATETAEPETTDPISIPGLPAIGESDDQGADSQSETESAAPETDPQPATEAAPEATDAQPATQAAPEATDTQ